MSTVLYLTTWDFIDEQSDGVCKKINNHIQALDSAGHTVDIIFVRGNDLMFKSKGKETRIAQLGSIKKTPAYIKMYSFIRDKHYDFVYNRFGMFDTFYCRVLRRLHDNGAKIILEIPTYPYSGERHPGLLNWCMFKWDEIYLNKVHQYIDAIATFTFDEEMWKIPTIHIQNGINVNQIHQKKYNNISGDVNLIAVALLQPYHGYERILKGMFEYYQEEVDKKVVFHIIGDGPEKEYYESLVSEYHLEEYVHFYGRKTTEEMDEYFDIADIGICSLGTYKKRLELSSELKSKEFMARGIPFIYGCNLDIEDCLDTDMACKYPNDSSVISIQSILAFYDKIKTKNIEVGNRMREMAFQKVDISVSMKPILDYMENN